MTESLKAARERAVVEIANCIQFTEEGRFRMIRPGRILRALQKQAMEAVQTEQWRCLDNRWPWGPERLDALLDGPAPEEGE